MKARPLPYLIFPAIMLLDIKMQAEFLHAFGPKQSVPFLKLGILWQED